MAAIKGSFNPNVGIVDLGDGVKVPAEVTVTARDAGGYDVELIAAYDAAAGRYLTRQVLVRATNGGEVTSEALRSIPVAKILRDGLMGALQAVMALSFAPPPGDIGKAGPTTETLQWVARIYRLALLVGDAPAQAVASALNVPRSTASRWATRARDRGFLTVVDPRAKRMEP